ncbi:MAG: response regulator [Lachnospiraceae bacterium]|nr:response regulator [Lachnospiraceae bacterium]
MKVIIVDDEVHMREAIELMIDWKSYRVQEVYYAQNGIEALKIIDEKKPDILLCDMEMPVMGGRELLREIMERQIKIQVIAVSGYSDFSYVYATLLANGVDYILKPFGKETLVNALEKAILKVQGEKEEAVKNRQHEQMGLAVANQILQSFCRGEAISGKQIQEAFVKLGAENGKFLLVSVLSRNASEVIENKYEGDRELCFFAVGNVMRDIFKLYSFKQDIYVDEFNWQIFLQEKELNPFRVSDKMKIFEKKIEEAVGLKITWVVSLEPVELHDLKNILGEQNGILRQRNVWGCGTIASLAEKNPVQSDGVLSLELRIISVMENKDREMLKKIIRDYCSSLKRGGALKLQELQRCTADMNLLIGRLAARQEREAHAELLSLWINDIDLWEKEVLKRLDLLMDYFRMKEEPAEIIYAYIKEHFSEDITLSTIAAGLFQTPQYVARIFKNRYHMTIVTAITKMRIEKACELLKTGKRSVAQVAEMVGYEDENYFGRVFKKHTGQTPAQYRRGQSE